MDQKEMMERLKRDPAALQAVMWSRDGQKACKNREEGRQCRSWRKN